MNRRNNISKIANETVKQFDVIIEKANKWNISIQMLPAIKNRPHLHFPHSKYILSIIFGVSLFCAIWNHKLFFTDQCLIEMPQQLALAFRPAENCEFCLNVTQVERVASILPADFEKSFAYNARPVIITDGTVNWTALDVFDYWYFKQVYEMAYDDSERTNCQFFPVSFFSFTFC